MTRLNNTRAKIYAIMTVRGFVIEGISNIGSLRLDVGSLNALIAPKRLWQEQYSKGYATHEMIKNLDLSKIRVKRQSVLNELEEALDVKW